MTVHRILDALYWNRKSPVAQPELSFSKTVRRSLRYIAKARASVILALSKSNAFFSSLSQRRRVLFPPNFMSLSEMWAKSRIKLR